MGRARVLLSNGNSKFQLTVAAAEAEKNGALEALLTAAYPKTVHLKWLSRLQLTNIAAIRRFILRKEAIRDEKIFVAIYSELFAQLATVVRNRFGRNPIEAFLNWLALWAYSLKAAKIIRLLDPNVYHFRSGYGLRSVAIANQKGIHTLCDHSIVHPAVLDEMIGGKSKKTRRHVSRFWSSVQKDLAAAKTILVNSDFVKKTFVDQGVPPERIEVVYWGVDDSFLSALPAVKETDLSSKTARLLFAGMFEDRKGGGVLADSVSGLDDVDWILDLCGLLDPVLRHKHSRFFSNPRVRYQGNLDRFTLANRMAASDVFVFPSLAEGSARVVFEAMAAGCYIITTENAGSIVKDGIHGELVSPGDSNGLRGAIRRAANNLERVRAIGQNNSNLVRTSFTQAKYGEVLLALYDSLISGKRQNGSSNGQ